MAIIVEEEKSKKNIIGLLGWVVAIAVLVFAIYYIFFAAPELVIIAPPASYSNIAPIGSISLDPGSVLSSTAFTQLTPPPFPLPTSTGPAAVGRADPFLAP